MSDGRAGADLTGSSILVVEDEYLILALIEETLRRSGARVAGTCRTLEDALAAAARDDISAALLDFKLGRHSSLPVARRLESRGIPFVFYSGAADIDPIRTEWPGCTILPKPVRPRTLVAALASAIAG